MRSFKIALRKIFIFLLSVFSFSGNSNAAIELKMVDAKIAAHQIETRMLEAQRKLLDIKQFQEQSEEQYPIAQWYNWGNWPNWPNWFNGWRNF